MLSPKQLVLSLHHCHCLMLEEVCLPSYLMCLIIEVSAWPQPVMNVFEPFIHEGSESLSSVLSDPTPIKILRAVE